MNKTPRVLLSAYQCRPGTESVSLIGWQWYSRLVKHVPVTLVTHIRNREHLLQAGAPLENSDIIFIDTEWFAAPLYNTVSKLFPTSEHAIFLFASLDFYVYDWTAVKLLKKRQQAGEHWDIIHSVTPVSPLASSRLYRLKKPMILGPWNGGLKSPDNFPSIMKKDYSWLYPIRNLGKGIDWILGGTRNAAAMLVATKATMKDIPEKYHDRCVPVIENGVDLTNFTPAPWLPNPSAMQPLRILFLGRLVPFKGLPMLLEALAQLKNDYLIEVTIVGTGPMETEWQQEAKNYHVDDMITWYGNAKREEVVNQLHQHHVLCLPSVRESGGAVLLEAMACARPVIAVAYGGPGEIVDEAVGYPIAPKGREFVVNELVKSLKDMFNNPDLWRKRGEEGRKRAESLYGWDAKVANTVKFYQNILQRSS